MEWIVSNLTQCPDFYMCTTQITLARKDSWVAIDNPWVSTAAGWPQPHLLTIVSKLCPCTYHHSHRIFDVQGMFRNTFLPYIGLAPGYIANHKNIFNPLSSFLKATCPVYVCVVCVCVGGGGGGYSSGLLG